MSQLPRVCALAFAACLAPAFAQTAAPSSKGLPEAYVRSLAECNFEVDGKDYANEALMSRNDAELQQGFRRAMAGYQADRAQCLRAAAAPHTGNRAVTADLTARLARNDQDAEQPFQRAREAFDADPLRYFKPMLDDAERGGARAIVAQARDYKPVAQQCPPMAMVYPSSPAESQAANRTLTAHRECLLQVANGIRNRIDFQADKFAEAGLRIANMERYTCARKPGPRCVPDASWRQAAELFSAANVAAVERAARAQDQRLDELKEANAKMVSWREQVNASVHKHNADVAARENRRVAEEASRRVEQRGSGGSTYYGGGDLQPPPVTIRRDSSVSAPGMR